MQSDELTDGYERAVLGAVLTDPRECPALRPEEFFVERHRVVWASILDLRDQGRAPDAVLVHGRLREQGQLEAVGGPGYLAKLVEEGCVLFQVNDYAQKIREAATSRALRRFGAELAEQGATADQVQAALSEMPRPMAVTRFDALRLWGDVQASWLSVPVRLGLDPVDRLIGGLEPGALVVVGGRTSHGKSSLLACSALRIAASEEVAVSYLTLETPATAMLRRMIGARAKVPLAGLRSGALDPTQFERAEQTAVWIRGLPLAIRDVTDLGTKAEERVRQAVAADPAQVIVVDHLQEVLTDDRESRAYSLGQFLSRLKELAIRHAKIFLLAAQVGRRGDRQTEPPTLGDLKESGGIEERADVVLLLHYAHKAGAEGRSPEELDVVVAKNRDGGTGKRTVRFIAQYGLVEAL